MTDNFDLMMVPSNAKNAMGGTELMTRRLYDGSIPREILKEVQIVPTRLEGELDPTKVRLYVVHDLPGDPSCDILKNGGWNNFHRIIFVSNWQMQAFIKYYNIPWSKCMVLANAIEPIPEHEKPKDKISLIYFSTPHRGLQILVPVFEKLAEEFDNIELNVYSSFKLYGWDDRDAQFEALFDQCRNHPKINYMSAVSNEEIRNALTQNHILAYPSIWEETSCLVLIEAMSAGLVCVHPNYGALAETSANWTTMYQYNEDLNKHASLFYGILKNTIENLRDSNYFESAINFQKFYANNFYNWNNRKEQWAAVMQSLMEEPRGIVEDVRPMFHYKVT